MPVLTAAIRLDLMTVRPYAKQVLLLVGLGTVIAVTMGDPYAATPLIMVYGVLVSSYAFAVSDKNNLETLYATLPLRRGTVVAARYLMTLLSQTALLALSLVIGWLTGAITGEPYSWTAALALGAGVFAAVLVVLAVQFPIYFALGYTRARLIAIAPLLVIFILVMVVANLQPAWAVGLAASLQDPATPALLGATAAALAMVAASAWLSRKLYTAKDL